MSKESTLSLINDQLSYLNDITSTLTNCSYGKNVPNELSRAHLDRIFNKAEYDDEFENIDGFKLIQLGCKIARLMEGPVEEFFDQLERLPNNDLRSYSPNGFDSDYKLGLVGGLVSNMLKLLTSDIFINYTPGQTYYQIISTSTNITKSRSADIHEMKATLKVCRYNKSLIVKKLIEQIAKVFKFLKTYIQSVKLTQYDDITNQLTNLKILCNGSIINKVLKILTHLSETLISENVLKINQLLE
ncbi:BA75_05173T0 [Komagataella pastoris]|uniref:BA75_05173T0 n=1 Tax=Komagataella pastoris TaxID=4922 RepID=A0A1B2JIF5_PICPA|nr:BA75_05173T0 [Komagataella pastoris]